jgi:hypothetical protein
MKIEGRMTVQDYWKKVISIQEILERFKALEDWLLDYHKLLVPTLESLRTRRWNKQCQTNFEHLLNVQWRMWQKAKRLLET